ncbi:unnamed protein product, partial [marine sediment metagenome]
PAIGLEPLSVALCTCGAATRTASFLFVEFYSWTGTGLGRPGPVKN